MKNMKDFITEAAARRCSIKKVFLKMSQTSQEITCQYNSIMLNNNTHENIKSRPCNRWVKGTVMQIDIALINDRWRFQKYFENFGFQLLIILQKFSLKVAYFLRVSIVFSGYTQNFTDQ